MSSASSVASSFSSAHSSGSFTPAPGATVQPTDPTTAPQNEDGDAYSDESFAAEDRIEEPVRLVLAARSENQNPVESRAQDDDNYDDDAFEDSNHSDEKRGSGTEHVDRSDQDNDAAEYSDTFEDSEDVVDRDRDKAPFDGGVEGISHEASEPREFAWLDAAVRDPVRRDQCEQGTHHRGAHLNALTNDWANAKVRFLAQRHCQPSANRAPDRRAEQLHEHAPASLLHRLHKRRSPDTKPVVDRSSHRGPRVPAPLVDRVHVHRLITLSARSLRSHDGANAHRSHARSLSTFCSVKTADLKGKLATQRLSDLCARWETSGDALSAATSDFLTSVLAQQRRALRPRHEGISPDKGDSVLGTLRTHATAMDRAVQTATLAVSDSQRLRQHAHRVLHATDAHACTCAT